MTRLTCIAVLTATIALARTATADDLGVPDFDAIRTPDSPAFTLLGVSPTQIERPNTPQALTAALSGFLSESGVAIPKSLAVEVAVYWLWSRPDLTFDTYRQRGVGAQLAQNVTLSVGTTSTDHATLDPSIMATDTTMAIGARTSAQLSREPVAACATELQALVQVARSLSIQGHPEYREVMLRPEAERLAGLARIQQEVVAAQDGAQLAAHERAKACVVGGGADARGWIMEAAAATSIGFPDSDPKAGALRSSAAWLTLAYKWIGTSVVGLARGRADEVPGGRDLTFDPGVRVIHARGRYAVSAEVVGRFRLAETAATEERDHTYRVALGFDLRLTDATWLAVSFGKDFAGDDNGKVFSLANLKWGFGEPTIVEK